MVAEAVTRNGRWSEPLPGPGNAGEPVTYSYAELLTMHVEPKKPLIRGVLDEGTGSIWAGPPNIGKTWLILTASLAIASGTDWLGHFPTTQRTVLFVDEESHLPGVQARLAMLRDGLNLPDDLPLHFAVGLGLRLDAANAVLLDRILAK